MTRPSDNPADPFKKALAEATKVMAGDHDLNVSYSVDPAGQTADTMRSAASHPPHDPRRGFAGARHR